VDELSEEGVVAVVIVHPTYVMVCIVGMMWKALCGCAGEGGRSCRCDCASRLCDGLYCWNDEESIVWMSCRKRA
jgi:hypothetical protein